MLTSAMEPTTIEAATTPARAVTACVVGVDGALRGTFELEPGVPLSIGRSQSSGIAVDDAAVSRLHATLTWDGEATVAVHDHGSRNGTYVGERRVEGEARARAGDLLRVGPARLLVVLPPREPVAPRAPGVMGQALALADRAAQCDLSVLLLGETGSGKEVVARRIHQGSRRAQRPFVAINCGSIPESLAESLLFGHERGAFTGAAAQKPGVFEAAHGGTLFLDEIGELPAAHQARLLRVLEQHEVVRVGSNRAIPVDVRVVAATHRDIDRLVERGAFRRDLLYRIDVLRIRIPPLRERVEELPELVAAILSELGAPASLEPDAIELLRAHPFPGNVRELRNVLARALALGTGGVLDRAAIAAALPAQAASRDAAGPLRGKVQLAEKEEIERALAETGGNQTHAARRLGISRRTLLYKMERLGIERGRRAGGRA